MQVVLKYDAGRGPITALAVTAEDCILAGTQDGCMMVFAPDSRRHITRWLTYVLCSAWPRGIDRVSLFIPLGLANTQQTRMQ